MEKTELNVLIGGEAGQGLVTIGELLAKSLVRSGYHIVVSQSYQSRIRGGHNTYTIRASVEAIAAPREGVDLLVALNAFPRSSYFFRTRPNGVGVVTTPNA